MRGINHRMLSRHRKWATHAFVNCRIGKKYAGAAFRVARASRVPSIRARVALVILSLVVWIPSTAKAEDLNQGAFWMVSQVNAPLGRGLSANLMVQNRLVQDRLFPDAGVYQRTVVRPWLAWMLPHRIEIAVGYDAHIFENPLQFTEQRAWQRIGISRDFGRFGAITHFWLEERFFPRSSEVAWRGRFLIGAWLELPHRYTLIVRNEFFVNLNTTNLIRRTNLGEDQFFIGVNRALGRHLQVEAGYLLQYLDPAPGFEIYNHTLVVGVAFRTPSFNVF